MFATICFALKAGLSLGSFFMLQLLQMYGYVANQDQSAERTRRHTTDVERLPDDHVRRSAQLLLAIYKINKRMTLQIADELAERRRNAAAQ